MKYHLRWSNLSSELENELSTDIELEPVPLMELSSLPEHIHVKTRETSQNTDLYMGEYLRKTKALQSIQGELVNTSKLIEVD